MSIKAMDRVFTRWFTSNEFRHVMDTDPDAALAAYELTEHERAQLSRLSRSARSGEKSAVAGRRPVAPKPAIIWHQLSTYRLRVDLN